jgi:uncharacterized protein (TIGR01777 family)
MNIVISGASGLIGTALVAQLKSEGHQVFPLVRRTAKTGEIYWNPATETIDAEAMATAQPDAVIHLAGAGIGDKRWSDKYKQEILESRVKGTQVLARAIAGLAVKPRVFLSGSAIGVYGPRGDEVVDESTTPATNFLAKVCTEWEAAAKPALDAGIRTVFLRTGIVLSRKGGALGKQLLIFKLGLGGKLGKGTQYQSWISIDDEVDAIIHLLTTDVSGAVNLTAPGAVTQAEFAKTLARTLRRPAFLPIPSFGPKLLLGGELADALLFTGQRVAPNALLASGYGFRHATLDRALADILKK